MEGYFLTDRGQKRSTNEDAGGIFFNRDNDLLAIVADGMGGHQAGEVASQMATEVIQKAWEQTNRFTAADRVEEWLGHIVVYMNKKIHDHALQNEAYEGMGTTIVVAACTQEFITIAHVGDSRCYLLNNQGFKKMTEDHSLVNELVRSGEISEGDAQLHPRKNVLLKALGTEESVKADIKTISWEQNDKLLLCSDGLTNELSEDELETHLQTDKSLQEISEILLRLANERGGEDNITLAVIEKTTEDNLGEEGDTSC